LNTNLQDTVIETAKNLNQPTLSELINNLVKKGIQPKEATKAVYIEWKKGKLNLTENKPPTNIVSYLFNSENLWFWATTSLVTITILVVFTVNASTLLYVRYVLGSIFVLFLPGFLLLSALYPRKADMDGLEKVAISSGLSLAIVPLVGLALNYTPWGITLEPIMISLAILSEIMVITCAVRRFRYFQLNLK
jgi:uncharacterized membrane protein